MITAHYDPITRTTANPADSWMESGRELRLARNLLTSYTARDSHEEDDHIPLGNGGGARL
jgi:hypothetical protein